MAAKHLLPYEDGKEKNGAEGSVRGFNTALAEFQGYPWVKFEEIREEEVYKEGQGKMIRHYVYKTGYESTLVACN